MGARCHGTGPITTPTYNSIYVPTSGTYGISILSRVVLRRSGHLLYDITSKVPRVKLPIACLFLSFFLGVVLIRGGYLL